MACIAPKPRHVPPWHKKFELICSDKLLGLYTQDVIILHWLKKLRRKLSLECLDCVNSSLHRLLMHKIGIKTFMFHSLSKKLRWNLQFTHHGAIESVPHRISKLYCSLYAMLKVCKLDGAKFKQDKYSVNHQLWRENLF